MGNVQRLLGVALVVLAAGVRQPAGAQTVDLANLSLENLLQVEVTSVSRKEQTLAKTAAAVYVISREDIHRSGARTLPDLLRMAPGVPVAQIDATAWAVSARGFNGNNANKLLVLIDGRSVYSPMIGGVHWEMQNLPLADIDRIEIIRGPGGSLWGANATNGVINIITKTADETQGLRVSGLSGMGQRVAGEVRYGGKAGDRLHYRVFGKYDAHGYREGLDGVGNPDDGEVQLGGMRLDWKNDLDSISVQGALQHGVNQHWRPNPASIGTENPYDKILNFDEGYLMGSWTRSPSSRSERTVQVFFEGYSRAEGRPMLYESWRIADMEARQRLNLGQRHEFVSGVGYRSVSVHIINEPGVAILPADERTNLFTGFMQDEIMLAKRLSLTPGVKVEHNSWTGLEWQPSIRTTWQPTSQDSLWAAASRAVRTPTKVERGLKVPVGIVPGHDGVPPMVIEVQGQPGIDAETLHAYELGYRRQAGSASFDIAMFRNRYAGLRSEAIGEVEFTTFAGEPALLLPIRFANMLHATTYGTEVTGTWQPAAWWKTTGSYAWLRVDQSGNATASRLEGPSPAHQWHLRSYIDLPAHMTASGMLYRVGAIEELRVDPYTKLDARFEWHPTTRLELAVTAQNLLHHGAMETVNNSSSVMVNPVRRAVFSSVTVQF